LPSTRTQEQGGPPPRGPGNVSTLTRCVEKRAPARRKVRGLRPPTPPTKGHPCLWKPRPCPQSLSRKSIHDSNRLRLGPGGHPSDRAPCPLALLRAAGLDLDGWLAGCHWNHEYTFGTGSNTSERNGRSIASRRCRLTPAVGGRCPPTPPAKGQSAFGNQL